MPTIYLTIRGDQLGTYTSLNGQGNGGNRVITISGLQPVGTTSDVYTVQVDQVNEGDTQFRNGQFVTITDANGNIIMPRSSIQPDIQQGLGAGDEHLVINSHRFIIDLGGVGTGTVQYDSSDQNADGNEGDNDGNLDFDEVAVPCFTPGTLIMTPSGLRAAETLQAGDLVMTRDNGPRPIVWLGIRHLRFHDRTARHRPIEIKPGSLGPNQPARTINVSPQHKMLMRDESGQDVLVPAKALTDLPGIRIKRGCRKTAYVSILLPEHNVIEAEGAATESFYPGAFIIRHLPPLHRAALQRYASDPQDRPVYGPPARPVLSVQAARALVQRLCAAPRQALAA